MKPTKQYLLSLGIRYNPGTGELTKRKLTKDRRCLVLRFGHTTEQGYVRVCIENTKYLAHQIAWLLHYGYWADSEIDHIDGNGLNNKIENLRIATRSENMQNRQGANSNSTSKLLGVYYIKSSDRYRAQITVDGRSKHLGCFLTKELAEKAVIAAKRRYHSHNTL